MNERISFSREMFMVERTERPRDEGVYISRIERDKQEEGKYTQAREDSKKKILMATFFSCLTKMFDAFSPSKKLAGKIVDLQVIVENLLHFKKLLIQLSQENLSNSADFATNLSDAWTRLLTDFDNVEILERKNLKEIASFRKMIDTIKNHPPDSEHCFGYYLLQHAGKDWLPFPFIEILENLHKEHQIDAKTSTLSHWFDLIDSVIKNLKAQLPFKPPQ